MTSNGQANHGGVHRFNPLACSVTNAQEAAQGRGAAICMSSAMWKKYAPQQDPTGRARGETAVDSGLVGAQILNGR